MVHTLVFLPQETLYLRTLKHYSVLNVRWSKSTRKAHQRQVSIHLGSEWSREDATLAGAFHSSPHPDTEVS